MNTYDLITTNVYSKFLSKRLLICGTCLISEWPEIVEQVRGDRVVLSVCLETTHLNTSIEKIASILAKGEIEEIVILTKDGSPHCIGLHFAVEWAVKMTKSENTTVGYYVVEHGALHKVDSKKISEKRHLSK
jgi:hypothetical protein